MSLSKTLSKTLYPLCLVLVSTKEDLRVILRKQGFCSIYIYIIYIKSGLWLGQTGILNWTLISSSRRLWGWSGVAMVSCILRHRGVQLKLAYSWARPAILVAGKGRGGMFLFLLFLHFHSCSYFFPNHLFHLLYYLFYLFSPFLWETTQNDPQGLTCR